MITNQDGLGTDSFPEDTFWPAHNKMMSTLEGEKVDFDEIHIDRSFPHENKPTRKPGTAMLTQYMDGSYDLANSFVLGDRASDVELAKNLGCKAIFISDKENPDAALSSEDWWEIADFFDQKGSQGKGTANHLRNRYCGFNQPRRFSQRLTSTPDSAFLTICLSNWRVTEALIWR